MVTNEKVEKMGEQAFAISRIYLKDISYEAPNTPEIFRQEWAPEIDVNMQVEHKNLGENAYEVVLQITVTAKVKGKTAFLVEIKYAGIFVLNGFSDEQLKAMLGSFCPNILFPYAREIVSETISRGSFPPLYLAPMNFDAFYEENLKKSKIVGN